MDISYIFYPIVVIGIFLAIWGHVASIVSGGSDDAAKFRRSVGSLLPLVVLVFSITTYPNSNQLLAESLRSFPVSTHIFAGTILGVGIIECGRIASHTDSDAGAAIYNLLAASIGTFLLYCFMKGALGSLNNFLLSFLVAAGLYVIFRKF